VSFDAVEGIPSTAATTSCDCCGKTMKVAARLAVESGHSCCCTPDSDRITGATAGHHIISCSS